MTGPVTLIGQQAPPPGGYRLAVFEAHIDTMARQLETMRASGDRRAVFQLTYLTFSREVLAGVRAGRFDDASWAIDMCCRFVEVYLEQSARWERRDPTQCGAWRHAFAESASGRASVLQAMLLGMNAHINYDLAFVTLGACRHAGDLASIGQTSVLQASQAGVPVVRYRDFLRINQVAWESLPRIQDTVLAAFHPVFYLGNLLARRLTMAMGERILLHAREASWFQTALLLHAQDDTERAAVERLIDTNATAIAQRIGLLGGHPVRMWQSWRAWESRGTTLDPAVTEIILQMARRDPAISALALRQLAEGGADLLPTLRQSAAAEAIDEAVSLAAHIARHAPAQHRDSLRRFFRGRDDRRERVFERFVLRSGLTSLSDGRWPLGRLRQRWRRREALDRAGLTTPAIDPSSSLHLALRQDLHHVTGWRATLGDAVAMRAAYTASPDELVHRLRRHEDRWIRLLATHRAGALGIHPPLDPTMTALIDRVLFLKETQAFLEVDPSVLLHVAERMREEPFVAGARVVTQGDPSDGIRFIVEGVVEVCRRSGERTTTIATLGRRDAIGELATLNATAATADCIARSDGQCLVLPAEVLLELLTQHHRLAIGLLRTLSDRLIATTHRLEVETA